jgi:hypothetical protein
LWIQKIRARRWERGNDPASGPFFGLAVIETLSGFATDVQCPFTAQHARIPGHALADHQRTLIAAQARHFEDLRQRHW